ncbi:uncharacterized protein PAC_05430 [Phialocephala subalpina]|uniref:Uncharacterized protein n=1 Tax=Phialocephala subalpina TaxID=576137 RepID=A0A1L7WRZ1_9HELO|nr:uncharacterized protein PAC_05430 [Phialocephala subalpina]
MPEPKNRQIDINGNENEGGTSSDRITAPAHRKSKRDGGARGHYEDILGTANTTPQPARSIDEFTQGVDVARQSAAATQTALNSVDELYRRHLKVIHDATSNSQRVVELQELCKTKDKQLERYLNAIDTFEFQSVRQKKQLDERKAAMDEEEQRLEEERREIDKKKEREEEVSKAKIAEDKLRLEKELKERKANQDKDLREQKAKLEEDFKRDRDAAKKKLSGLESDKKKLIGELALQEATIKGLYESLAEEKDKRKDMEELRKIERDKAQKLKDELDKMKNEFGLNNNTPDFYKKKLNEISDTINAITSRYCKELEIKDWEIFRGKLKATNSLFASIPISDSQESKMLRIAYAQRLISSYLCKLIWQPFSSDNTFQDERKDLVFLLWKLKHGLESKQSIKIWSALTTRSLKGQAPFSLPPTSSTSQLSLPQIPLATRAERFLESLIPVLSLLVQESDHESLKKDLLQLADSAISIWDSAQSEESLDINIISELDPNLREQWRSPIFDGKVNNTEIEIISSTHPRIFTLFPRFATIKVITLPGTFDSTAGPQQEEDTILHPGIGLAECSALVIKGKEELQEREEEEAYMRSRRELENAKKKLESKEREWEERKRLKSPRVGSVSGSGSPTEKWSSVGGSRMVPEE